MVGTSAAMNEGADDGTTWTDNRAKHMRVRRN